MLPFSLQASAHRAQMKLRETQGRVEAARAAFAEDFNQAGGAQGVLEHAQDLAKKHHDDHKKLAAQIKALHSDL